MRHLKTGLTAGGVIWIAGWVFWGSHAGFAGPWIAAGLAVVGLYALSGWLSYRGDAGRLAGVSTAAAVTLAVGIISFFHLAFLAGGVAVMVGCMLRPS